MANYFASDKTTIEIRGMKNTRRKFLYFKARCKTCTIAAHNVVLPRQPRLAEHSSPSRPRTYAKQGVSA
ncbi:hypothetical protein BJX66DRAFT_316581 [Aspergillus keveii]|uniref:Uncharacterized protein n=1 Tax=Aspergillus keveii TaxID=714993 RepID=A0ABR4FML5_9EURO